MLVFSKSSLLSVARVIQKVKNDEINYRMFLLLYRRLLIMSSTEEECLEGNDYVKQMMMDCI